MLRRFLLISLTILISSACSCEGKKQQKTNHVAVSAGQITEENCNLIGENLQAFLTQNAKPLKKWPFKEWGDRIIGKKVSEIPMPKGVHISGDELKEFLSLDQVNHYDSAWNKSRKEWVDALLNSGTEYKYCGTLDVSDSLDCYVYTAENKEELGYPVREDTTPSASTMTEQSPAPLLSNPISTSLSGINDKSRGIIRGFI